VKSSECPALQIGQENTMGYAKVGQLLRTTVDPGHVSNQIGHHKKCATDKIGQLCELDPDHVSNQIGQQQKNIQKTQSAKYRKFIVKKFRVINFNFVLISYFAK
jgi:hypothetical protein